jgi:hypothetical protein
MTLTLSGDMPQNVNRAVNLLYASAVLIVLFMIASWLGWLNLPLSGAAIASGIVTMALLALTANRIANRRNWARWLFAVIYALGLLTILSPSLWKLMSLSGVVTTLLQTALQTAALIFVFTTSANTWFRSRTVSDQSAV